VKIQLAADSARFVLTLNPDPGNAWRYNLPKPATTPGTRGWRESLLENSGGGWVSSGALAARRRVMTMIMAW